MSDFPRGWTLNAIQNATGVDAAIVVPGVQSVTHVLDSIYLKIVSYTATAAIYVCTWQVLLGGVSVLGGLLAVPAGQVGSDSVSFGGLDLAPLSGLPLAVQFSGAGPPASFWQEITIQGHDI